MSTHAQLSPSKRHRWALCPGSVREEAKFPEERSNAAAIDGTHSHTLLEHCIKAGLANPLNMVGVKLKDDDGEFVVDQSRAERVKVAIDHIVVYIAAFYENAEVISEKRVNSEWFTGRDDLSGTVDVQIVANDTLEIIDYKDGMAPIEAENNLQLEQYAIGKLAEYKLPINMPQMYPFKRVRMTIIQPKLALRGLNPVVSWDVPVSYLLERVKTLTLEAMTTDAPNAPLVPGESQCKYCRAKGSCSALASNVMKEVGIMFQPIVNQTLDIAQQSADKDPAVMSDEQICQIMEAAPLMRQLLEGVEKEALRRLQSGKPITGLKLVNGRGSRAWNLSDDEIAEKLIKMGIPKSAIYETKLVSPAKVEKLTWQKRDGSKVTLSELQLKRLEQEYVSKLAGKPTVVSESDSRPAITTNAAPLFGVVVATPVAESLPSWLS
jgi:hypothetical protein